jgi:hypothetical protein
MLTGSPYRVTVICSGEQIRMTGKVPKVYAKTGDNGRTRFQHFCPECGSPLFHQRRRWSGRLGNSLGQYPPARPAQAEAANLVPIRGAMDQRSGGIARPTSRLGIRPCTEGAPKAKHGMEGG